MNDPYIQVGLQPHSPTLFAAYALTTILPLYYIHRYIVLLLIHCYLVYLHEDLKFDTHLKERLNDYSLRLKDGA